MILTGSLFSKNIDSPYLAKDCEDLILSLKNNPLQKNYILAAGTFECSSPVVLDRNQISLKGTLDSVTGQKLSTLKAKAGQGFPLVVIGSIQTESLYPGEFVTKSDFETPPGFEKAFKPEVIERMLKSSNPHLTVTSHHVYGVQVSDLIFDGNAVPEGTLLFQPHSILESFLLQKNEIWGSLLRDDSELSPEEKKRVLSEEEKAQLRNNIRNNTLTIRGASDVNLSNLFLMNARSGGIVTEKFSTRLSMNKIVSVKNYFDGIAMYKTYESKLTDITVRENSHAGISLDLDVSFNTFSKVDALENGHQGIFARYIADNSFVDMLVSKNGLTQGADGIFLAQWSSLPEDSHSAVLRNQFTRLTLSYNKGYGIRINDRECYDNQITNLISIDNAKEPWSVAGPKLLTIDGNKIAK